jgi:hypothetical protein
MSVVQQLFDKFQCANMRPKHLCCPGCKSPALETELKVDPLYPWAVQLLCPQSNNKNKKDDVTACTTKCWYICRLCTGGKRHVYLYDQLFFHDRRCKKSHAQQQAEQQQQPQSKLAVVKHSDAAVPTSTDNNNQIINHSISNKNGLSPSTPTTTAVVVPANLENYERFDVIRILRSTRYLLNATVINKGKKNKKIPEHYFKEKGEIDEQHIFAVYGSQIKGSKLQSLLETCQKDHQEVKKAANDRIKHVLFQLAVERKFKNRLGHPITKWAEIGEEFEQDPMNRQHAERLWELYFGSFDRCSGIWQKELEEELLEKFSLEYEKSVAKEEQDETTEPDRTDNDDEEEETNHHHQPKMHHSGRPVQHTFLMKIISAQRGHVLRSKKTQHEKRCGYYLVKSIDIVDNNNEDDEDGKPKASRSGRKRSRAPRPLKFHDEYLVPTRGRFKRTVDQSDPSIGL